MGVCSYSDGPAFRLVPARRHALHARLHRHTSSSSSESNFELPYCYCGGLLRILFIQLYYDLVYSKVGKHYSSAKGTIVFTSEAGARGLSSMSCSN